MKRRFIFGLVVVALLLNLAVGAKIYLSAGKTATAGDNPQANLELFNDAIQKIRREYVDGKELTYQQLVYAALKGAVGKLDPHSEFLDADSFQQLQNDTEGQFGGLGLVVAMRDGYPINVLGRIRDVPEVCSIYCATANPVQAVVAESEQGRGVLGVIDGFPPKGVETAEDAEMRRGFLRMIGYKR